MSAIRQESYQKEEVTEIKKVFISGLPAFITEEKKIGRCVMPCLREIMHKTKKYGHCFATNAALAKILNTTSRNIQRWLATLKEAGYIRVEYGKNKFDPQRKIYLSSKIKKFYTHDKNVAHILGEKGKQVVVFPRENARFSKDYLKKENGMDIGKFEKVSESRVYEQIAKERLNLSPESVKYAYQVYLNYKLPVYDWWKLILKTCENFEEMQKFKKSAAENSGKEKQKEKPCYQKKKKREKNSYEETAEKDLSEPTSQKLFSMKTLLDEYFNGSPNQRTFWS